MSGSHPLTALPNITTAVHPTVRKKVIGARCFNSKTVAHRQIPATATSAKPYVRLLNQTSNTGQMRNAQNEGENPIAETYAMRSIATPCPASKMGTAVEIKPK